MSFTGTGREDGSYLTGSGEVREKGAKRKKLAGYLKAANDLRQSYQAQYTGSRDVVQEGDNMGIPGAFPDVSITTHGDEQLVLFPSYCKRHTKEKPELKKTNTELSTNSEGPSDAEYWKREWEKWESDKAIVDVDVRGWVYSPHKGPMTRKNRLLVGLARQLSGIPAPKTSATASRDHSPEPHGLRGRHEAHQAQRDQERIAHEAEEILNKGEGEAAYAAQGAFSERPAQYDSDSDSVYGEREGRGGRRGSATPSRSPGDAPGPGHLSNRASWNIPSEMTEEELHSANTNLMARLMPFMTNPLVATPITVFFYDEHTSQSKTVTTTDAGHFSIRAALDFVPTHVRVLASENLSTTVEVKITEPTGVSIISDVDDTIKHSSIGAGAREIFRNAFIRDLADLTIDGVKEWYNTMYDMGVGIHYVSNSPWQLFPVLVSFFQKAGLPPGSYHLKQYSGMLQGIFEPVAERKKGTLERIFKDFPNRRFLLIGDSGEADLEVYTDVAVANPGRVIGIFIRDVTTPETHGFFDSSTGNLPGMRKSSKPLRGVSSDSYHKPNLNSDAPANRPRLPARTATEVTPQTSTGPAMGNLIDFDSEPEDVKVHQPHKTVISRSLSDLEQLDLDRIRSSIDASRKPKGKTPPARPTKPASLRTNSIVTDSDASNPKSAPLVPASASPTSTSRSTVPPPPPPRNPRSKASIDSHPHHPLAQTQNTSDLSSASSTHDRDRSERSYLSSAREKVSSAYNALPSLYSGDSPSQRPLPPTTLPRRGITATAATYLPSWSGSNNEAGSSRNSVKSLESDDEDAGAGYAGSYGSGGGYGSNGQGGEVVNKKLDLWRRRWRRAQEILGDRGVELRAWRVGGDVVLDAVRLVELELRESGGVEAKKGGEAKVKDLKS